MNLYELSAEYRRLLDAATSSEDAEADAEMLAALGATADALDAKVENTAKVVMMLKAEAQAAAAEAERLAARAKRLTGRVDWLRDYLRFALFQAGVKKVETPLFTVSLRRSPPSCIVHDEAAVPEGFLRMIPATYEIDKRAIIDLWKSTGESVAGVEIVADKHTVSIK